MNIFDIVKSSIDLGVVNDFRQEEARNFRWKEIIDDGAGNSFFNVYPDSGIVKVASLLKNVRRVAVGIDLDVSEIAVMLAWAKDNNKTIDLFIGHHPVGRLESTAPFMIYSHAGNLRAFGVDVSHLEQAYTDLVDFIMVDTLSSNFVRIHDILHYLGVDCICVHTPADNAGAQFVFKYLEQQEVVTLRDTVDALLRLPEYAYYQGVLNVIPTIIVGSPEALLGKYTVTEFVGGEEGPSESFREMKKQGIDTILCMHITEEGLKVCKEVGLNIIATGHMNSDSVGLNILCDILEKEGIEIVPMSGFVRVSRN